MNSNPALGDLGPVIFSWPWEGCNGESLLKNNDVIAKNQHQLGGTLYNSRRDKHKTVSPKKMDLLSNSIIISITSTSPATSPTVLEDHSEALASVNTAAVIGIYHYMPM